MVRINHLVLIGDNGVLGLWLKSTISHSRLSQMSKILLLKSNTQTATKLHLSQDKTDRVRSRSPESGVSFERETPTPHPCAVAMSCATLVNTQTHTRRQTAFDRLHYKLCKELQSVQTIREQLPLMHAELRQLFTAKSYPLHREQACVYTGCDRTASDRRSTRLIDTDRQ